MARQAPEVIQLQDPAAAENFEPFFGKAAVAVGKTTVQPHLAIEWLRGTEAFAALQEIYQRSPRGLRPRTIS
jgi:hypothetical protein